MARPFTTHKVRFTGSAASPRTSPSASWPKSNSNSRRRSSNPPSTHFPLTSRFWMTKGLSSP
jgi:hypothetical protein